MNKQDDPTKIELTFEGQKVKLVDFENIDEDLQIHDENGKNKKYYELTTFFNTIIRDYVPANGN